MAEKACKFFDGDLDARFLFNQAVGREVKATVRMAFSSFLEETGSMVDALGLPRKSTYGVRVEVNLDDMDG